MRFSAWGLGFGVQGVGFGIGGSVRGVLGLGFGVWVVIRIQGFGFLASDIGFNVKMEDSGFGGTVDRTAFCPLVSFGFWGWGLGFRAWGLRFKVWVLVCRAWDFGFGGTVDRTAFCPFASVCAPRCLYA